MLLSRLRIKVSPTKIEANLQENNLPASKKEPNIRGQLVTSSEVITMQEWFDYLGRVN